MVRSCRAEIIELDTCADATEHFLVIFCNLAAFGCDMLFKWNSVLRFGEEDRWVALMRQ